MHKDRGNSGTVAARQKAAEDAMWSAYKEWYNSRREPKHADYSRRNYYTIFDYYTGKAVGHVIATAEDLDVYCEDRLSHGDALDFMLTHEYFGVEDF